MKGQTFSAYEKLIEALLTQGYRTSTVYNYIKQKPGKNIVILRHDVDVDPHHALQMAKLEKNLGVNSTFYFRYIPKVFNKSVIKSISDMGFEVGYHYETLDRSYGNFPKAVKLFRDELQDFRKIVHVKTVCAHGNVVRNKHYNGSNYDIFKFDTNLLYECNLSAEAYLNMSCPSLVYISDSIGYSNSYKSVEDLIEKIKLNEKAPSYYILSHPFLWANGIVNSLQIRATTMFFHLSAKALKFLTKSGFRQI
jgi:peptidoglycan/xylan/chitin deacetylase (PgdA/CDA1 family)